MGVLLDARRKLSSRRLSELKKRLAVSERIAAGKACIYVTGSFARGEASPHSDLDLFIVGRGKLVGGSRIRQLRRLDEICVKADLIRALRRLGIPEFSGDGEYLTHYTVAELVQALGTPSDDAENTFTARLLLLLESKPLLGDDVYKEAIEQTINAYWRDFADHKADFMPAFLANDILRLWRTFCVNYEARTEREPAIKRAKRKLKNYKLKHSRLLTCYSALLHLMATWMRKGTVTPSDAMAMVRLTPTERLESLRASKDFRRAHRALDGLLRRYEKFLKDTDAAEETLIERLRAPRAATSMFRDADEFGRQMFEALEIIGRRSRFHQMLVV
jgi:predicted nucleotidyltransferase